MGWFIGLFLIILTLGDYYVNTITEKQIEREKYVVVNQQATEMVRYINAINHYLYQYPEIIESGGTLSALQAGMVPVYPIKHIIFEKRVYVWTHHSPGLISDLMRQTISSALLGNVVNRRLIDLTGADMLVRVPSGIPDGAVVYLN